MFISNIITGIFLYLACVKILWPLNDYFALIQIEKKSAKLLTAPRTLGGPGLCPAQLTGCDTSGYGFVVAFRFVEQLVEDSIEQSKPVEP